MGGELYGGQDPGALGDDEPMTAEEFIASVEEAARQRCTCPDGDTWACIYGYVYGPCTSDMCGGVCELEGWCDCTATKHKEGHQHE